MSLGKARIKYLRVTPRKTRQVIELVKGQPVDLALDLLKQLRKSSSVYLYKAIESCAANIKSQKNIESDRLYISHLTSDPGPMLKRFRAQTMGRGNPILKRTMHITVELDLIKK